MVWCRGQFSVNNVNSTGSSCQWLCNRLKKDYKDLIIWINVGEKNAEKPWYHLTHVVSPEDTIRQEEICMPTIFFKLRCSSLLRSNQQIVCRLTGFLFALVSGASLHGSYKTDGEDIPYCYGHHTYIWPQMGILVILLPVKYHFKGSLLFIHCYKVQVFLHDICSSNSFMQMY